MNPTEFLDDVTDRLKSEFEQNKRVMSFEEYLEVFTSAPRHQSRASAQYLLDAFHHFGSRPLESPRGATRRWNLFDSEWDGGDQKLIGQELAQDAVYRIVQNFARQRRINKLVLLHGPNGSAKSSLLGCIARAVEQYSRAPEGAAYCFGWVFPSRDVSKSRLGFGGGGGTHTEPSTYAHLTDEQVAARIPGDLRDHPLLLLPKAERRKLLDLAEGHVGPDGEPFQVPDVLRHGELSPRNQQIAELLYAANGGDLRKVLRHVQVQRFYISRRFRRGAVTVEPQLHVDANVRQLTGDRSLNTLPRVLQATTLYEPFGDLVDAHRGLIEYSDLLKRPLDSFKYLLATSEKGSLSLSNQILFLDLVMMASSNETHLSAFKEYADWPSFKGRIELVRVPYILDYRTEQAIYDEQITAESVNTHIAPHATELAALWAVLTRLRKPQPDKYQKEMRGTIAALTPLQKADLYASGRTPAGLAIEKARRLKSLIADVATETRSTPNYEGRTGASPREMKMVLLNAAQRDDHETLSAMAVLAEIEELLANKSIYTFLQQEPEGQYGDHESFVAVVKTRWLDQADDEMTRAVGLVTRDQYDELFRRYLLHVSHVGRGEKLMNPVTGQFEEPDEGFMAEMEKHFGVEKDGAHRSNMLGRIGAASQSGPVQSTDYRDLFPDLFDALEESYYAAQRPTIRKIAADALIVLGGDGDRLSIADRKRADDTIKHLIKDFGYNEASAREVVSTLLSERY